MNGGSYTSVGNVIGHPSAEGNFFFDPEAAQIVISVLFLASLELP